MKVMKLRWPNGCTFVFVSVVGNECNLVRLQRVQPRPPRTLEPRLGPRFLLRYTAAVSILLGAVSSRSSWAPLWWWSLSFFTRRPRRRRRYIQRYLHGKCQYRRLGLRRR